MINANAAGFPFFSDASSLPIVGVRKDDGDYSTVKTHNFCNNTTWAGGAADSTWTIEPTEGKNLYITSSRVQFLHDLVISPRELVVEHFTWDALLETPVLSETKIFKSGVDLFSIASAHFSAPAMTGIAHGLTTIEYRQPVDLVLYSIKTAGKFAKIVIKEKDHLPIVGTFLLAAFETMEKDA